MTTVNCVYPWGMSSFNFPWLWSTYHVKWGCSGQLMHTPGSSQEVVLEGPLVLFFQGNRTVKPNLSQPLLQVTGRVREKKARDRVCNYSGPCFIYTWGETPEYEPPGAWGLGGLDIVGGCLLRLGEPRPESANMPWAGRYASVAESEKSQVSVLKA